MNKLNVLDPVVNSITVQDCYDLFKRVYLSRSKKECRFYQFVMYTDESGEIYNVIKSESVKQFDTVEECYRFLIGEVGSV